MTWWLWYILFAAEHGGLLLLNLGRRRQRQVDLYEFKVILVYIASSGPARATK